MSRLVKQFDRAMAAAAAIDGRVLGYVDRYMGILGVSTRPLIVLRDNLGSVWLGRCTWTPSRPDTSLMELQRSILEDDRTLERIVAHEVVHHRDNLNLTPHEKALVKLHVKLPSHGTSFMEGAARINSIMGAGFVNPTSDRSYVQSESKAEYLLLISRQLRAHGDSLGWEWGVRLGPRGIEWARREISEGARLVRVRGDRWTRGPRIEYWGSWSFPSSSEETRLLQQLYDTGPRVTP